MVRKSYCSGRGPNLGTDQNFKYWCRPTSMVAWYYQFESHGVVRKNGFQLWTSPVSLVMYLRKLQDNYSFPIHMCSPEGVEPVINMLGYTRIGAIGALSSSRQIQPMLCTFRRAHSGHEESKSPLQLGRNT